MKNTTLNSKTRIILFLCGIVLISILFIPIWRIDLSAPQYPEGLDLFIFANKLDGNVDIINGLNHYIGMKTLHTEDFIEFKILPYVIIFFAALFLIVAFLRNRKLMYVLFILFLSFGIISMIDFWKWEYDYGHNLNPHAAIIVPGMVYQPPLIGFKQLLNFGAYSIPDTGGWLFITTGALLLLCVIMDVRAKNKARKIKSVIIVATIIMIITFSGCTTAAEPINIGKDDCQFCKMTISDARFGVEVITKKGKVYKYDEAHCFLAAQKKDKLNEHEVKEIYFTDYLGKHELIKQEKSFFLKSEELKSPMGGNVAAFSNFDSLKKYSEILHGEEVNRNLLGNE
ncbi:MAG: nitrous oxide reductase accessory protein NosL [Bacteroidia bacterium]